MTDTALPALPSRRARARRAAVRTARWTGIGVLALIALLVIALFAVNTGAGKRYVVNQINALEFASGLDIDVGTIEGSLFGELTIRQIQVKDLKGTVFYAPEATLDWRPFAYFRNHIDIRALKIPKARLFRLPELRATGDPDAPLLPDIDIDIGSLEVGRLEIDPAVSGRQHLMRLAGGAKISDGRAQLGLAAITIAEGSLAGGDVLRLKLDAVPEANRFDVDARLTGPGNGFVAGMIGVDRPIDVFLGGRGDWAAWQGKAGATLAGDQVADLSILGKDGTFTVTGPFEAGQFLAPGILRNLLGSSTQMNLVTRFEQRRADTKLRLSSPSAAVAMEGVVDLANNQFDAVKLAARLSRPQAIAPNMTGQNVRLAAVLNGPFATPFVAYDLTASMLGFDQTRIEGLRARGRAKVDTNKIRIPVSGTARRIAGINPAFGSLLNNVRVDGTLNMAGASILSDDLKVRSDKLRGTVVLAANMARGEYRAGLQGQVDRYQVESVGLFDIDSKLDVVSRGQGFAIKGRVAARSRRIDMASARDILGGQAVGSANIDYGTNGILRLDTIRLTSPGLRITSGRGIYGPNGRIDFDLAGTSRQYGPVAVKLTGTSSRPDILLRAANPGFGLGLSNVEAFVRSTAAGYAITATGGSRYGPFNADIVLLSRSGPMTVDVRRLTVAGLDFRGRVQQTRAGPYQGQLDVSGQGLTGVVRLAASGQYQRADIDAHARDATIPGEPPITIRRGIIRGTAILYPGKPQITGDIQLAGVRRGGTAIEALRGRINYQNGSGGAQLIAQGRSGVPYRIAANVALSPELIRVAAKGTVNRIPFSLARPAEIYKQGADWVLRPATIAFPQGNVRLAGRYGNSLVLQTRMDQLDLSIVNAFIPNLGFAGKVTGSVDFIQGAGQSVPRGQARLNIANFTRTGIVTVATPVDIAFAGRLDGNGANSAAVIRRGGAVIGRMQARLSPLGGGSSWTERLMSAPLSGGIRYNGPAQVLWSLTGITGRSVSGPVGLAADFTGSINNPDVRGVVRANNLTFDDETYGTRITNLAIQGRFNEDRLRIVEMSGRAGSGTVTGSGTVGLSAAAGYPIDINLKLANARIARSNALGATATGEINVRNSPSGGALISGELALPTARYELTRSGAAQIAELEGVRRKGEPLQTPEEMAKRTGSDVPSIWKLDIRLRARSGVTVTGMGLDSDWAADLRITGTSAAPAIAGTATLIRGDYSFSGSRFELTEGEVDFDGSIPTNPRIRVAGTTELDGVDISVNVTGRGLDPQITFTSVPSLPQDEIMSRLLFGGSVTELSALQLVQLGASLNTLRGGGGGAMGRLRGATGLSRLRILGADEATGRGTALSAGFNLGKDIYLEVITDARGFTATQIEIALTRALSLLTQAGTQGATNVNLRYRKQY